MGLLQTRRRALRVLKYRVYLPQSPARIALESARTMLVRTTRMVARDSTVLICNYLKVLIFSTLIIHGSG
jgi:hypothetical protein